MRWQKDSVVVWCVSLCKDVRTTVRRVVACAQNARRNANPKSCVFFVFNFATIFFIFFPDGTDNSPLSAYNEETKKDQSISSVLKLHLLAGGSVDNQLNEVDDQVCIYKWGIGTISDNGFVQFFNKVRGFLDQQIKPMRKKLEAVYEKDDIIYVIGFSRGAASARALVSDLDKRGIYTATTKEFVERPKVAFLGCFDTVSMQYGDNFMNVVGRFFKYKFLDLIPGNRDFVPRHKRSSVTVGETGGQISDIVERAVHNVALDDDRMSRPFPMFFPPVLMDSGNRNVSEVWFAGEHGDVGGTYYKKDMSDYSLLHMKEWMEEVGLTFVNPDSIKEEYLKVDGYPDVKIKTEHLKIDAKVSETLHLHNFSNPSYRPAFAATDDNLSVLPGGKVLVHESVLLYAQQQEQSEKTPYVINPLLLKLANSTENVVVVGRHGKELVEETKAFRELLLQQKSTSDI